MKTPAMQTRALDHVQMGLVEEIMASLFAITLRCDKPMIKYKARTLSNYFD